MGKHISLVDNEPKSPTAKMVNKIAFLGVTNSEILAEGFCPNCITMVDLWVTSQGLELSLHGKEYKVEPTIEMNKEEHKSFQPSVNDPTSNRVVIESLPFNKGKLSLITKIMDFLLMPISCPTNLKKTI